MDENINTLINELPDDYFNFNILVNNKQSIKTKVRVTRGFDADTGDPKPIFYRYSLLENKINIINLVLEDIDKKIEKVNSDSITDNLEEKNRLNKELNVLNARRINIEAEKLRYTTLLDQPYQEWTAEFKAPSLPEQVSIDSRSFTEDAFGEKSEFNASENIRAKFELLLIKWDAKDNGVIIPIKDALKADPDLLKAFSEEFDLKANGYVLDERKK
jgi:hypothetical protein